ncbi:MAG: hypothetical protein GY854_05800 [Deltaproteobacteria bacterium]|nr:hypothetical protein [Deltaproteobacteria bacterium]
MRNPASPAPGRLAGVVLLGAVVLVATITGRLLIDGKRHFDEALRLKSSGDREAAVTELEDAAKAYVPGSPYPTSALRELAILAKAAEMRGETVRAAAVWEVTRRAILATRHFSQPHAAQLENAETEITRLRSDQGGTRGTSTNPIERPTDPNPFASMLLFVGLVTWAGGAILLCLTPSRDEANNPRIRRAAWIVCLGGLALWLLMAWIAK